VKNFFKRFVFIAFVAIIGLSMITCGGGIGGVDDEDVVGGTGGTGGGKTGGGGGGGSGSGGNTSGAYTGGNTNTGGATPDRLFLDVSGYTDWDYMVIGKDGSSMVFNVNKSTGAPTLCYLKPKKDSDAGYTILFKANGLPDIMIQNDHIFYFGNFGGYNYDMAVIDPVQKKSALGRSVQQEGPITTFMYGQLVTIETDMYLDELASVNEMATSNYWSKYWTLDNLNESLDLLGTVVGLATCAAVTVVPPAGVGCFISVLSAVTTKAVDKAFEGTTNDVLNIVINALNCATAIGGKPWEYLDCASLAGGVASLLTKNDIDKLKAKMPQIEEAIKAVEIQPVFVSGVVLSESAITLAAGERQRLAARILPSNATKRSVMWTSSNENVATVDYDGLVKAVAVAPGSMTGTATITVKTYDGDKTATCTVTVTPAIHVTGMALNKDTLALEYGGSETLTATFIPANATHKVIFWSSDNESIATVNSAGLVTAVNPGTTTITVTAEDGNKTASCVVTVNGAPPIVEMVRVDGGTFQYGKNLGTVGELVYGPDDRTPVSTVTVGSFYIGKYEVTQKQWLTATRLTPRYGYKKGEGDNYPAYNVNWFDVLVFCNRLSIREGLTPAYSIVVNGSPETDPSKWGTIPRQGGDESNYYTYESVTIVSGSNGYRMPTGEQWEYAAKGGNKQEPFSFAGSNNVDDVAWYYNTSDNRTHEVGTKAPNGLGLYDMSGNVSEWIWERYNSCGGSATGSFSTANYCRIVKWLGTSSPTSEDTDRGFRIVRPAE